MTARRACRTLDVGVAIGEHASLGLRHSSGPSSRSCGQTTMFLDVGGNSFGGVTAVEATWPSDKVAYPP